LPSLLLLLLLTPVTGRIINIVSILGRITLPLRSPYCIVKFGVEAFSDCLRLEMRRWGVDVIVVEPGDYTTGEQSPYIMYIFQYTIGKQNPYIMYNFNIHGRTQVKLLK
jgi:short-subunit dehydrogenase